MKSSTSSHSSSYLLLTLTALFWSGNWVVGRGVQGLLSPIAISFWRWAIALLILIPFVLRPMAREWATIRRSWKTLLVLGALGVAGFNTFAYTGLKTTTATNGLLLNSVIPVLIIGLSWLFLNQRPRPAQALGLALSLGGVATIITRADPQVLLGSQFNPGDLWVLMAVVVWAAYTVGLRWRPPGLSALAFLGSTVTVGVAVLAPLYAWDYAGGARIQWSLPTLAALGYLGLFPSVLAYIFWNRAVAEVGPSQAGVFIHLVPVFGTVLAMLFLGEALRPFHLGGIGLIFGGIYLSTARRVVAR